MRGDGGRAIPSSDLHDADPRPRMNVVVDVVDWLEPHLFSHLCQIGTRDRAYAIEEEPFRSRMSISPIAMAKI